MSGDERTGRRSAIDDQDMYARVRTEQKLARAQERRPALQAITQSAVAMDMLGATSEFQGFMAQVQALLDVAEGQLATEQEKNKLSRATDYATLVSEKLNVHAWEERRKALQEVLDLVGKNRDVAAQATRQLAEDAEETA